MIPGWEDPLEEEMATYPSILAWEIPWTDEPVRLHPMGLQRHTRICIYINSVQFSRSVVSDSLRPHGLQHARPLRPSPTPGVYSNSCPLSQ